MRKILNLFSLFFAVIGLCTVTLICHIVFIYPNLNKPSSNSDNTITTQTNIIALDTTPTMNPHLGESTPSVEPLPDQEAGTDQEADLQTPATDFSMVFGLESNPVTIS